MALEEALNNIAAALNNIASKLEGGYTPPSGEPPASDDPNEKTWHMKPKSSGNWPVYRTPTTQDIRKRIVKPQSGATVIERTPPKKIGNTPVWETEADLYNILIEWAWLPRQDIVAVNGRKKQLPFDWEDRSGKGDSLWQGCFVEREYLA